MIGIDMDVVVHFKSEGAWNKIQLVMDKCELSHNAYPPLFLTLLFVNYDGSLVNTISHREKLRLGLKRRHRGSTAVSLTPALGHL